MAIEITPIYLVLAVLIGLLVGLLVASIYNARTSKSQQSETPPDEMTKDGYAEVASLWYSPAGKKIATKMDGEYYREYLVLSPEQKKKVLRIINLWSAWSGITSEKVFTSEEQAVEAAPVASVDQATVKVDRIASPPAVTPAFSTEIPAPTIVQNDLPAIIPPDLNEIIAAPEQPEPDKPKTIAGQISQIIAKMIEDSPLREKGIKLIENENQGVDVWIGMEKFDGIDAIPYPEAKQLILAAVAQWEREADQRHKESI